MKPGTSNSILFFCAIYTSLSSGYGLQFPWMNRRSVTKASMSTDAAAAANLADPAFREKEYGDNIAKYLVDLHDSQATFDFCGGMMFQLVLSKSLREQLLEAAQKTSKQPVLYDASKMRMHQIPDYHKTGEADDVHVFHGREIRQVPHAKGGMGFVLQLSSATSKDPEGWTEAECLGYDGWGHDSGRTWRQGSRLEEEGFTAFREQFGPDSFALHHRFYLHVDGFNRFWLSAEDGCEGVVR